MLELLDPPLSITQSGLHTAAPSAGRSQQGAARQATCRNLALLQGGLRRQHTDLVRHCRCPRMQTTTCRAAGVALSGSPGSRTERGSLLGRLQPRFRDHPFRAVVTLACRAHRSRWCWSRCCSVTAHMLVWLMPDGTLQHLPGSRHPGWRFPPSTGDVEQSQCAKVNAWSCLAYNCHRGTRLITPACARCGVSPRRVRFCSFCSTSECTMTRCQVRLQRPRAVMGASLALPKVMGAAARLKEAAEASKACCVKLELSNALLLCTHGDWRHAGHNKGAGCSAGVGASPVWKQSGCSLVTDAEQAGGIWLGKLWSQAEKHRLCTAVSCRCSSDAISALLLVCGQSLRLALCVYGKTLLLEDSDGTDPSYQGNSNGEPPLIVILVKSAGELEKAAHRPREALQVFQDADHNLQGSRCGLVRLTCYGCEVWFWDHRVGTWATTQAESLHAQFLYSSCCSAYQRRLSQPSYACSISADNFCCHAARHTAKIRQQRSDAAAHAPSWSSAGELYIDNGMSVLLCNSS
eukprot:jgi/Astpho2/6859/fgenesh1_pg.00105_%23_32_t